MMRRLRKLTVCWASPMYPSRRTKEILLSPFQAFLPSKTYSAKWQPLPARPDIEFCGRTNEKFFSLQTFNQVQLRHPTVLVKVSQVNLLWSNLVTFNKANSEKWNNLNRKRNPWHYTRLELIRLDQCDELNPKFNLIWFATKEQCKCNLWGIPKLFNNGFGNAMRTGSIMRF